MKKRWHALLLTLVLAAGLVWSGFAFGVCVLVTLISNIWFPSFSV